VTAPPPGAGVPGNGNGPDGEPRPVADVDQNLPDVIRAFHRTRWYVLLGAGILLTGAVVFLLVTGHSRDVALAREQQLAAQQAGQLAAQQRLLRAEHAANHASCRFWASIAALDVQPPPPAPRPSKALVTIVASARDAYAGQSCGRLPPASGSLTRWARYYQVPVR
jgi:hypothetical protein